MVEVQTIGLFYSTPLFVLLWHFVLLPAHIFFEFIIGCDVPLIFKLSRSSEFSDVEINPGPDTSFIVLMNLCSVVFLSAVAYTLLNSYWFSMWVFAVASLSFITYRISAHLEARERARTIFRFGLTVIIVWLAFLRLFYIRAMDPVLARDSTMHDVELNPGPQMRWSDDPVGSGFRANLGLALHQYDVRTVLASHGVPLAELESHYQRLTSADACAKYYLSKSASDGDVLLAPAGSSAVQVAKAFRAVYPQLRDVYLAGLVRVYSPSVIHVRLLDDFPVHNSISERQADVGRAMLAIEAPPSRDVPEERMDCLVCGFNVVTKDHDTRCQPQRTESVDTRVAAWIGDAIHTLDVRLALVVAKLPVKRLSLVADMLKSGTAQHNYMMNIAPKHGFVIDTDVTIKRAATLFESVYHGTFRDKYIEYLVEMVRDMPDAYEAGAAFQATALIRGFGLYKGLEFRSLVIA